MSSLKMTNTWGRERHETGESCQCADVARAVRGLSPSRGSDLHLTR